MQPDNPDPVSDLAAQVFAFLRVRAAELDLSRGAIDAIRPRGPVQPSALPVLGALADFADLASPETEGVVRAIIAAARHMRWRQTYSREDGFPDDYFAHYGWFDLAGPNDGPYHAEGLRIYIGCWGQGFFYPDHSHPPEEHYIVLAGGAGFRLGQGPWRRLGPGDVFHTPPGAVHSADMRDGPLMAMAIWRHDDVSIRINLTDQGRDVVLPSDQ